MGIFSKVLIGGLAFLAGAAFMANENEEQQKGRRAWKRIPNNPLLNANQAPLDQDAMRRFHNVATDNDNLSVQHDAKIDGVIEQMGQKLHDIVKQKFESNVPNPAPTFTSKQGYPPVSPPDAYQIAQQQPLFKFPIYSTPQVGSQPQKKPWGILETDCEKGRQIGVLEVYRDSINELIEMPEFKLDKEAIKRFLDNQYVQAFLKARLSNALSQADWFRSSPQTTAPSQPSSATNPTAPSPAAGNQQVGSVDDVVTQTEADANSVEWRNNSVVSVSGGQADLSSGNDPFDH